MQPTWSWRCGALFRWPRWTWTCARPRRAREWFCWEAKHEEARELAHAGSGGRALPTAGPQAAPQDAENPEALAMTTRPLAYVRSIHGPWLLYDSPSGTIVALRIALLVWAIDSNCKVWQEAAGDTALLEVLRHPGTPNATVRELG